MTTTKLLICLLPLLVGCSDFTFGGLVGAQTPAAVMMMQPQQITNLTSNGEVVMCVSDKQCAPGLICFKPDPNNYVGMCGQIITDTNEGPK